MASPGQAPLGVQKVGLGWQPLNEPSEAGHSPPPTSHPPPVWAEALPQDCNLLWANGDPVRRQTQLEGSPAPNSQVTMEWGASPAQEAPGPGSPLPPSCGLPEQEGRGGGGGRPGGGGQARCSCNGHGVIDVGWNVKGEHSPRALASGGRRAVFPRAGVGAPRAWAAGTGPASQPAGPHTCPMALTPAFPVPGSELTPWWLG